MPTTKVFLAQSNNSLVVFSSSIFKRLCDLISLIFILLENLLINFLAKGYERAAFSINRRSGLNIIISPLFILVLAKN